MLRRRDVSGHPSRSEVHGSPRPIHPATAPGIQHTANHPDISTPGGTHAVVVRSLTSHPFKARTENAGLSPDQALTSPSAKHREVFGQMWGDGGRAVPRKAAVACGLLACRCRLRPSIFVAAG
ncbi:unnamed protein product, partial [Ectocarpus sp. 12 AP-2014]